jgi:PPP family 3-phenylpropionic acid transporter
MALMSVGLIIAWQMPIAQASIGSDFGRGLRSLMKDSRWLLVLLIVFIAGMSSAFVHTYLFLYLADLGADKTVIGLSLTIATVSEFLIFFFSDRLLTRWDTGQLISFSLLTQTVRLLAYSLIRDPWLALGVQLLHGPHFSAMWIAGVAYANKIAPTGMGATAQSLFTGMYMGLGSAAGALIGGFLLERVGSTAMFQYAAGWSAVGLVIFLVAGRLTLNEQRQVVKSKG